MLTNLPTDFKEQIDSKSRKPIQLIHFTLSNKTYYYLSDSNVGVSNGLSQDYSPWVESWGTLKDNTFINTLYQGGSLEARSGTITLIVSNESRTFLKNLFNAGVENTVVDLYQWFGDIESPPELIDTMVCQDPINYSETSMILTIDMVSVIMQSNPYLWPEVVGQDPQPVIIGKALKMPLKDLQTSRVTQLSDTIDFDYVGPAYIDNGIGFPATGEVVIDSEYIRYDLITAGTMNIVERGLSGTIQRPHLAGANISPKGAIYDFAICSGPVDSVDNLQADGEPYVNEVTFFPGQNPVIARFAEKMPWLKITPGEVGDPIIPDPQYSDEPGTQTEELEQNQTRTHYITSPASINDGDISSAATLYQNHDATVISQVNLILEYDGAGFYDSLSGTTEQSRSNGYDVQAAATTGTFASKIFTKSNGVDTGLGAVVNNASGLLDLYRGGRSEDLSHLGTLDSWELKIEFPASYIQRVMASDINVYWGFRVWGVAAGGAGGEEILAWDINYPGTTPNFVGQTFTVRTGTEDWAQMGKTSAWARIINTRAKSFEATGEAYTERATINFRSWFEVKYTPTDPTIDITPSQELLAHFNRDLSGYGTLLGVTAKLYYSLTLADTDVLLETIRRNTNSVDDNIVIATSNITSSISGSEYAYDLGITSWEELKDTRVGIKHTLVGPEAALWVSSIQFSYVKFQVYFQPDEILTPDEARVVYATELYCDVTSHLGADPTPPQVVQHLLEDHSNSGNYIDIDDFNTAHLNYDAISYYLNGALDPGIRLHEALRQVLMEGMLRFLFNQGKIKVISYFEEQDPVIDLEVSTDDILIKSRRLDNQPTDVIKNDITVSYNRDYSGGGFLSEVNKVDDDSILKFTRREDRRELSLISSEYVANLFADRLLNLLHEPSSVYSFEMFMKAFIIEKGDKISAQTFLDKRFTSAGNVLSVERAFGQGKVGKINTFKISMSNPLSFANLELSDAIIVNDNSFIMDKGLSLPKEIIVVDDTSFSYSREFKVYEVIEVVETFNLSRSGAGGYGVSGYGETGYGV